MRLIVTNFNPRFTGVSATIASLVPLQAATHDLYLYGKPLPGCPKPVSFREAVRLSCHHEPVIWHVRRNAEMLAAIFARDVLRLPIRIVFTSAAIRRHSAFPRWLISQMDGVVATSKEAAAFVPHVIATIPHGVDLTRFRPAENRASAWAETGFGASAGFITVGRVRPEKGTDIFVETMISLLPQMPEYTAVIIGKTTREHAAFESQLRARIAKAGLSGRILFAGEIDPARMPLIMSGASLLFALPRYEGFGLTMVESMACGTPVVASDAGYFREFVGDSHAGRIVPVGDVVAAAEAARDMLADSSRYAVSRSDAIVRAGEYAVTREADELAKVYRAVTGLRP